MIRKILLILILIYITIWVIFAHLVKDQSIKLIKQFNSDNLKILYEDANISGFPYEWKIKFTSPKIILVQQNKYQEFIPEEIIFSHDFFSSEINFGKKISYNKTDSGLDIKYSLIAEQDVIFKIIYNKALFFIKKISNIQEHVKLINISIPTISALHENKEIFKIDSIKALIGQEKKDFLDLYKIKITGNFNSNDNYSGISKTQILLDMNYLINEGVFFNQVKEAEFDRKIEINNFHLKYEDSEVNVNGFVSLNRTSAPKGKLDCAIIQYQKLVDKVVPDNFIVSKSFIKKIINKAHNPEIAREDVNNANFKIEFSNKGATIGKLNLLELHESD